jgi:hypothetical protein
VSGDGLDFIVERGRNAADAIKHVNTHFYSTRAMLVSGEASHCVENTNDWNGGPMYSFKVEMPCGGCSGAVERALKRVPGVESVSIDLAVRLPPVVSMAHFLEDRQCRRHRG